MDCLERVSQKLSARISEQGVYSQKERGVKYHLPTVSLCYRPWASLEPIWQKLLSTNAHMHVYFKGRGHQKRTMPWMERKMRSIYLFQLLKVFLRMTWLSVVNKNSGRCWKILKKILMKYVSMLMENGITGRVVFIAFVSYLKL